MARATVAIIVVGLLLAGCAAPAPTPTPTQGAAVVTATTVAPPQVPTAAPTDTSRPTPTATPTPESTSTFTPTSTPPPTATPQPTPTVPPIRLVRPVDPDIPIYNCFDLDRGPQVVSNCGRPTPAGCTDGIPQLGTKPNHPGYDYGTGICPVTDRRLAGREVYGMGDGVVFRVVSDRLWVDYGVGQLADGAIVRVVAQYGHITPAVAVGQTVGAGTVVAYFNEHNEVELQILVLPPEYTITLGEQLPIPIYSDDAAYPCIDPKLAGLEPI